MPNEKKPRQRGQVDDLGDGVFRIRVPLGTQPDGSRPYHNETLRRSTPPKAWKRVTAILAEVDSGDYFSPKRKNVSEVLDEWLERRRRSGVKRSTVENYETVVEVHLRPAFGELPLRALTTKAVQDFCDRLQDDGHALSTVNYIHDRLKSACKRAVKLKWLKSNPCEDVELPPPGKPKKAKPFDEDEARRFIAECRKDRDGLVFIFALATGVRPSEYTGVDYAHLSLTEEGGEPEGLWQIEQAVTYSRKGGWYFDLPKTPSSIRPVCFPVSLYHDLMQDKEAHLAHLRKLGKRHQLIFTDTEGNPLRTCLLTRRFFRVCERAGLSTEGRSLYTLRRTHGSLSLIADPDDTKALSERMGHKSVSFTLDEYTDVLPALRRKSSKKMENLLFGTKSAQEHYERPM